MFLTDLHIICPCSTSIRIKANSEQFKSATKSKINNLFKCIGLDSNCIELCRYCKSRDDVLVKLKNIMYKVNFLDKYNKCPVTYIVYENEGKTNLMYEKAYTIFCKCIH